MKQRLPLFETFAAVLAVAAVAFLTALPNSGEQGGEKNVELHDGLSVLRTAVFRFSMDHEVAGSPMMPGGADVDLEQQLVGRSRGDGGTELLNDFEDRFFGPYLENLPVNPVNGLSSVRSMPPNYSSPVLNGSCGWVYVPATGKIYADLAGADARGVAYLEY
ncbi:MAG: hypothetical protein O3A95_10865 [Planctomycetota bacterium]|nr:hypothetical protein [Planctomycetota bacterium]MDA1114784.1 hypothetical protein [Planctomycetota bacterium]